MRAFAYSSPTTITDVLSLLDQAKQESGANHRPLAGGTDLLTLMKAEIIAPEQLIDIKRVAELTATIDVNEQGTVLGALTTLGDIEIDPGIRQSYPVLAEAAAAAASPQLRNMATIGGNLLQRPRCWYYRNSRVHCWLTGGDDCPAREGENALHAIFASGPCVAVHPSDLAPALIALDATVQLRGPLGERSLPVAELFAPPEGERRTETVLASDELIVSVQLPKPGPGARSTYLKAMDRKVWAFALVSVAASLRFEGSRIAEARLLLGGVAPVPWRAVAAERALTGAEPSADLIAHATDIALTDASPLHQNGYKVPLASALIRRALGALLPDETVNIPA